MIGRIQAPDAELTGASDIAGDVQRADQATVDRTEHVGAARPIGVHLDRAGNRGAVERACNQVGNARARRSEQHVAAQVHAAAQEKDGGVLDVERGRADTECTGHTRKRVGANDHASSGKRGRPLVGVRAREQEIARTGLVQVAAECTGNAAQEAHHRQLGTAVIRIDVNLVGTGDGVRREVGATQEEQVTGIAVAAHHQVANEVDLILQGHLCERAIDAEGAEAVDLVDGDLTRTEGKVIGGLNVNARIDERAAAVVVAVIEGDAAVPLTRGHVAVDHRRGRRAVFGDVGAEFETVGARQDVFETVVAENQAVLVAAEADAVDAVGARTEGRGEVNRREAVVGGIAAATGTEPELAATRGGLDRTEVEGVILPAAAEADAAEVASRGGEADLTRGRGRRDEADEVGLRDVIAEDEAGERVAVGLRDDLLRRDVGGGEDIDHRTRVEDDIAHAERRTRAGQALNRAGGVVAVIRVDVETELAGGAEGVTRVHELERTRAELGDATAGDHAFKDGASGVVELRVKDVVIRPEGRRAGERDIARGTERDGRQRAKVG